MDFVVIGISGKATSGKSTAREFIKEFIGSNYPDYGFTHHSFAAELKSIAYDLFAWDGIKDLYPEKDKGRGLLINIGEKMREIRPDVWADYVIDKIKNDIVIGTAHNRVYVIDDLRYQNELALLRETFGNKFFWANIKRPGIEELDTDSERGLDSCADFDATILNENLDNFKHNIKQVTLQALSRTKERIH